MLSANVMIKVIPGDIVAILYHGECLEVMGGLIDQGVKVDAVITDPPYGTTACKWDSVIPFPEMWERLEKLIKPNGAIVLFGSEPFSSALRMSNIKRYKYDWVWEKNKGSNFAAVKYQPMKEHENVLVFYKGRSTYNEIRIERSAAGKAMVKKPVTSKGARKSDRSITGNFDNGHSNHHLNLNTRCARSVIKFNTQVGLHPTQKPVPLMEYLIKTYTNPGEMVLDFTMGSGTTGVACKQTGRNFIGIEQDGKYFDIAFERIKGEKK